MKAILLAFFILLPGYLEAAEQVLLVGHFSSLRATEDEDPHTVEGYSIRLYQSGSVVFGSFAVATGALEPAQGRLSAIRFNRATGKLSFTAKVSTGRGGFREAGPQGRPLRDLYIFSGRVTARKLVGTIVHKDGYDITKAGKKSVIAIPREEDDYKPATLDEWRSWEYLDQSW